MMKYFYVIALLFGICFFLYGFQYTTYAYWVNNNGVMMWYNGEILGETDEIVYTYVVRAKPTSSVTPTPTLNPTPTEPAGLASLFKVFLPNTEPSPTSTPIPQPDVSSCFPAGTLITMADGKKKPIEKIEIHDTILSYNGTAQVYAKVKKTSLPLINSIYKLVFSDGTWLRLTPGHPVFTNTGWKSINPEITKKETPNLPVEKLKVNDAVMTSSGSFIYLYKILKEHDPQNTYNINEIEYTHTFYANNILVHNKVESYNPAETSSDQTSNTVTSSSSSSSSNTRPSTPLQVFSPDVPTSTPVQYPTATPPFFVAPTAIATQVSNSASYNLSDTNTFSNPTTPVTAPRPTNTPYPTQIPLSHTFTNTPQKNFQGIPTPTPIPEVLRGKTSTIVIEMPTPSRTSQNPFAPAPTPPVIVLKGEDMKAIKIGVPLAMRQKDQTMQQSPPSLDVTIERKEGDKIGINQEEFIIQKGLQTVSISSNVKTSGTLYIQKNGTGARITMPISIDPTTNIMTVETPQGPMKVSIMPDDALAIIEQLKVVDQKNPFEIVLEVHNGQLQYRISSTKIQKLFWLIPIAIPREIFVAADTGGLVEIKQSPLYDFISLFAF